MGVEKLLSGENSLDVIKPSVVILGVEKLLSGENSLDVIKPSVVLLQKKLQLNTSVYKMVHFNVKRVINQSNTSVYKMVHFNVKRVINQSNASRHIKKNDCSKPKEIKVV